MRRFRGGRAEALKTREVACAKMPSSRPRTICLIQLAFNERFNRHALAAPNIDHSQRAAQIPSTLESACTLWIVLAKNCVSTRERR